MINRLIHFLCDRHIHFLSASTIYNYLRSDPDGFFRDLDDRNRKTRPTFMQRDFGSFNSSHKKKLKRAVVNIDENIKYDKLLRRELFTWNIDPDTFLDIPWVFALMTTNQYESGMAHTRGIIIFISTNTLSSPHIEGTLLHEKIHVFQKLYPTPVRHALTQKGYRLVSTNVKYPTRMNPDIDKNYYIHPKYDVVMTAIFSDPIHPASIKDVVFPMDNIRLEHPFEECAYEIQDLYTARCI